MNTAGGSEPVKGTKEKVDGDHRLKQKVLMEGTKVYLTEYALLADFAPPFARGAPFLRREPLGQIVAFTFSTEKLSFQERSSIQPANSSSSKAATAAKEVKEGAIESDTCQETDEPGCEPAPGIRQLNGEYKLSSD